MYATAIAVVKCSRASGLEGDVSRDQGSAGSVECAAVYKMFSNAWHREFQPLT